MASATDVDYYVFAGKKGQRVVFSCLRLHHRQPVHSRRRDLRQQGPAARRRPQLQRHRRPDRLHPARRRRLLRPPVRVHAHRQHPGGTTEHFYRLTHHHRSLDRRRLSARGRAGQDDAGDHLRPQPARRPARSHGRRRTATYWKDHRHRHRPGRPGRRAAAGVQRPHRARRIRTWTASSTASRTPPARRTRSCSPSPAPRWCSTTAPTTRPRRPRRWRRRARSPAGSRRRRPRLVHLHRQEGRRLQHRGAERRSGRRPLMYLVVRNAAKNTVYESPRTMPERCSAEVLHAHRGPGRPIASWRRPTASICCWSAARSPTRWPARATSTASASRRTSRTIRLVVLPTPTAVPTPARCFRAATRAYRVRLPPRRLHRRHRPDRRGIAGRRDAVRRRRSAAASARRTLVLTAAADAAAWTGEIKIKGTAVIKGQPVVREARAGGIVWPSLQPQQAIAAGQPARPQSRPGRARQGAVPLTADAGQAALTHGDKGRPRSTVKLSRLWPDFKQPLDRAGASTELPGQQTCPDRINNNQPINIARGKAEANCPSRSTPTCRPASTTSCCAPTAPDPVQQGPQGEAQAEAANITWCSRRRR